MGNLITRYTYNANGQLAGSLDGNGQTTSYLYDGDGNVTRILTKAADGTTITSQLDYTYDADGHPVTATSLDGAWTYSYDAAGQLIYAVFASINPSIPDQDLTYEYDAAGNRIQTIFNGAVSDYSTNGLNQYTSVDGTTYSYDADGNLVSMTQGGVTTEYTYNSQNQLIAITRPTDVQTYQYDALGHVVSSADNGITRNYIIDPLAEDTSATGPLSAIGQIYDPSGHVISTYDYGDGPANEIDSSGVVYLDLDLSHNVVGVSGNNGSLVATYDYMPFGLPLASTRASDNRTKYSGGLGEFTLSDGLVNMRARYYNPDIGRFITSDPMNVNGGINLYRYGLNSPLRYTDPTGAFGLDIGGFLSGAGGVYTGLATFGLVGETATVIGSAAEAATIAGLTLEAPFFIPAAALIGGVAALGYGSYDASDGSRSDISIDCGFKWN